MSDALLKSDARADQNQVIFLPRLKTFQLVLYSVIQNLRSPSSEKLEKAWDLPMVIS